MFEIDGKVFRNIQEQVQKNKTDIAAIRNVETVLNDFGVTVLGRVNTEADIPEGTYEYGNAYLVGTETPYDMYIYTRTDIPNVGEFINIGPISMVGPVGPVGPAGTVEVGETYTSAPGSYAAVHNSGTPEHAILDFRIPRGNTGNGIYTITKTATSGLEDTYTVSYTDGTSTTFTVTNGAAGRDGADGDPGESFMIMGNISSTSLLPDPSITPRNHAYVYSDGDISTADRMYYITGEVGSEVWSYSSFAAAGTTVSVNGNPTYAWNADTKLDKQTSVTTTDQVYVKRANGSNGLANVSPSVSNWEIVQRGSTGQINVPETPTANSHATSKQYVDGNFASISVAGEEYDPTRTYNKFEHCRHDGKAYYCYPAETTTGPWDATKWTEFNMGQLFYTSLNLDNTKLDKNTSTTASIQAYIKNADGTQGMLNIRSGVEANSIVRRDGYGDIELPLTPSANSSATSKKYVDDKTALSAIRDLVYPVGSIYMSVNNTSPATLFGGTWEALNSGNKVAIPNTLGLTVVSADTTGNLTNYGKATTKYNLPYIETQSNGTLYPGLYNNGSFDAPPDGQFIGFVADNANAVQIYMWKRAS